MSCTEPQQDGPSAEEIPSHVETSTWSTLADWNTQGEAEVLNLNEEVDEEEQVDEEPRPQCALCWYLPGQCNCPKCENCGYSVKTCDCSSCKYCHRIRKNCSCGRCDWCAQLHMDCCCITPYTQVMEIRNNTLFQHYSGRDDTVPHAMQTTEIWDNAGPQHDEGYHDTAPYTTQTTETPNTSRTQHRDGRRSTDHRRLNNLIVRGNLNDYHILAIRKPSANASSAGQRIVKPYQVSHARVVKHSRTIGKRAQRTKLWISLERLYNAKLLQNEPKNEGTHINVTTKADVALMVAALSGIARGVRGTIGEPQLGFDLEGWNLGRSGITAYMQLRDYTIGQTYLIDLHQLGRAAFDTPISRCDRLTLRDILENPKIEMLIVDSRQDADALNFFYGVRVQGVLDLQIMEILTLPPARSERRMRFARLMQLLGTSGSMSQEDMAFFNKHKTHDFEQYEEGYREFLKRPLSPALKLYAINDVLWLDRLFAYLKPQLSPERLRDAYKWSRIFTEETWAKDYHHPGGNMQHLNRMVDCSA